MIDSEIWGHRSEHSLTATLHHLVFSTPDIQAMSDFYRKALGYRVEEKRDISIMRARDRRLAFVEGEGNRLDSAGFAVPNREELLRLKQRLQSSSYAFNETSTVFFSECIEVADPDGTKFTFGLPLNEDLSFEGVSAREARLQHVVMASENPEKVVDFFTKVLGFTVADTVLDDERGLRVSFLCCSAEHHSFAVFKAPRNRFDHCSYELVDWNAIRDWSDHFSDERIRLQWGPGRHGPGNNLFVFIHDPDGNWVELSAELEIMSEGRVAGEWPHEERTLNYWGQGFLRS